MTSIIDEVVPILRRLINDLEEPYMYTDNVLSEYIEDAVFSIKTEWEHDYEVDSDNNTIEPDVEEGHRIIFAWEAKLQLLDTTPSISFRSGSLNVTRKDDTQKRLEDKIAKAVEKVKLNENVSYLQTELE